MSVAATDLALLRPLHPGPLGSRFELSGAGQVLGRDASQAEVLLAGPQISRRHAWIGRNRQQAWEIHDLESRNGLFVNGERVNQVQRLNAGDVIGLGSSLPDYQFQLASHPAKRRIELRGTGPWSIGRDLACDLALPADLTVSQRHAVMTSQPGGVLIDDCGSRNGLWQNARRQASICLQPGDAVMLGHQRICLIAVEPERLLIELEALDRAIGLKHPTLRLEAGQLHRIRIESESDRRRLMNQLGRTGPVLGAGFSAAWLEQQPARQLDRIALVEAGAGLSGDQTLGRWLGDELHLRLSEGLSEADEQAMISTTLAALDLDAMTDRPIGRLSAIECRCAQLASALLTRPGLLIATDVLAGLDDAGACVIEARLDRLAGPELTLILLDADRGQPSKVQPDPPRHAPQPPGQTTVRRLGTLMRRQFARPARLVLELLALPLLAMLGLVLLIEPRSGMTATLATLLISTPLAAFSLSRLAQVSDGGLIERYRLTGAAWLTRLLAAAAALIIQFLATLSLASLLLPPDAWTVVTTLEILLAAAAGLGLGLCCERLGRGGLWVAVVLGMLQAAVILGQPPGTIVLVGLVVSWLALDASLAGFSRSRRRR